MKRVYVTPTLKVKELSENVSICLNASDMTPPVVGSAKYESFDTNGDDGGEQNNYNIWTDAQD